MLKILSKNLHFPFSFAPKTSPNSLQTDTQFIGAAINCLPLFFYTKSLRKPLPFTITSVSRDDLYIAMVATYMCQRLT